MKKLAIGLLFMTGFTSLAGAACLGPFCFDDTGAYIAGVLFDGNGDGTPSLTKAQMQAAQPRAAGQEIYCSNCLRTALCVSTGTTVGGYVIASETGTMPSPTHCQ